MGFVMFSFSFQKPAAKNGSVTASAKNVKPAAAASSSDLSEDSSDEDDVSNSFHHVSTGENQLCIWIFVC